MRCRQQLCVINSSFYMFSLCSLILGPQPPPLHLNINPLPPTSFPRLACGPGGAGACRPEDRGSAGSQKHLSVPFPLQCNPPGTALSQPAPAVCVCGCVHLEWMITEKQVCISAHVHSCSMRDCFSACQSLPLNTPF